ncbi:archaetidylserine decarboxylase [Rubrivirga marina]|uniref:Phosphatidylserine decarboxylase proenzyme n=1 Tax=Rubrivirga marina TaxID=1196024 RepID=A0A271IWX2_9BACT|nr:archaetidylserine decarboxylase [Rubrivirga marina]PAP75713.1 phosphatidylserine decarboxylase [Rubrivirga marina]
MSPFVALQRLLPHHLLSRSVGRLAASERAWLRDPLVRLFARVYGVEMDEAERTELASYRSFNDFFTRSLAEGARPIAPGVDAVASPADGVVSQAGTVADGHLIQAKGIRYSLEALAGSCADPAFEGGPFCTVYLSPKDYHRVHVPLAGRLVRTEAIPGKLFSVNATTEAHVDGLFAVNERLACLFETEHGKVLAVMVGALIVASIETVWDGPASPYRERVAVEHDRPFEKGEEMGRFLLGSSVVLAFERDRVTLDDAVAAGHTLRMGQAIGRAI